MNKLRKTAGISKNDELILKIDDYSAAGEGIGHANDCSFFVKNALLNEKVRVAVTKVKSSYAYAGIIEIIDESDDRREPECRFYRQCGGCNIQHMSYDEQLRFKVGKVENALHKLAGINKRVDEVIAAEKQYRYRNKAQYPVGYSKEGETAAGFYAARSHNIIAIDDCMIEPEINAVINSSILDYCKINNILPYDEQTHTGLLRHIMIRHGFKTGEIMICAVLNSLPSVKEVFEALFPDLDLTVKKYNQKNGVDYKLSSFVLNYNNKKTNVIMGDVNEVAAGREYILDEMNGIQYAISANSFYQVNHDQAELLYKKALELAEIKPEDVVFDIYCGAGTIGLYFAKEAKEVYGIEIVPEAVKMADFNARLNNISNISFYCGDADSATGQIYMDKGIKPDVVVVDPPRKGCSEEMLDLIAALCPSRLIYVSCDPATMARDLKILTDTGDFIIKKVVAVDQFCQNYHVECVVLITRNM